MGVIKQIQLEEMDKAAALCVCGKPFGEEHQFYSECSRCGISLAYECVEVGAEEWKALKKRSGVLCGSCFWVRMFLMPENVPWKFELIDSETGEVKKVLKEGELVIYREYHEWTLNLTKEQIEEQSKDLKYWPDPSDLEDEESDST